MALDRAGGVAHIQSLPSFAQAFSASSLSSIPGGTSLPPISQRTSSSSVNQDSERVRLPQAGSRSRHHSEEASVARAGRKRTRTEATSGAHDDERSDSESRLTRVKTEPDQDELDTSPPATSRQNTAYELSGAPPPSSLMPQPAKKRRVTISSGTPALNTDVRVAPDQANSTPISPVVMGFTVQRDNPAAVEQVRSMLTVKQQQKALIEQRRGSVAGIMSPSTGAPPENPIVGKSSSTSRPARRSPGSGAARRHANAPSAHSSGHTRPTSPNPPPLSVPHPQQNRQSSQVPLPAHSLPPPPISFARRRANQLGAIGKRKPADIVISPREDQTPEQFAPSIQSAPPIPAAGGYNGRFQMSLPRLPPVLGTSESIRRPTGGFVPPTPTRLATVQRNPTGSGLVAHPLPGISGRRSPANASVPISTTLHVPPTPHSLHHPGYSGEKSAFLAPFEMFYDALNDSKQLKTWLGEQLQRSQTMMQSLQQQQDRMHEVLESMVEKKVGEMRNEMAGLYRRIDELEDALKATKGGSMGGRRPSFEGQSGYPSPPILGKGKQAARNGPPGVGSMEAYSFPPQSSTSTDRDRLRPEPDRMDRRMPSPGWGPDRHRERERDYRDSHGPPPGVDSPAGSPAPFDGSRRMSVSATRMDPPRQSMPPSGSSGLTKTPPSTFRDPKSLRGPGMHRQHSSPLIPQPSSEKDRAETSASNSGPRNLKTMSPPETRDDREK